MGLLELKKFTSFVCYLLLGLFLVNVPLNQVVLCMESDGHSNIEYSVFGFCEKSLFFQSQSQKSPDAHVDECEDCKDISLTQATVASKENFQNAISDDSFLQVVWILDSLSFDFSEPIAQHWDDSYAKGWSHNSSLAHRQTIVLLI